MKLGNWRAIPMVLAVLAAGCGSNRAAVRADDHDHESAAGGHPEAVHREGEVNLSEAAQAVAGIRTVTVQNAAIQASMRVPGTVTRTEVGRAVVTPPVAGRVTWIAVRLGQVVRAGQVLAILESPDLAESWATVAEALRMRDAAMAQVEQGRSEVNLAVAKLAAARISQRRQRDLARAGAFSQAPLLQAQSEWNDAQSELLSIQKEQGIHAEQLRRRENLFRDGIVAKSELEAARLELQQDEIRLERAQARIESTRAAYDREKNIASRGLLNAKELQSVDTEVKASALELERERMRLRAAESALKNATKAVGTARAIYASHRGGTAGVGGQGSVGQVPLIAAIDGTITDLSVTQGQAVDRTQGLMEIANLKSVWISASVPERDIKQVRIGASVRVTLGARSESGPESNGEEYRGAVEVIGSRVEPKSRTVAVLCRLEGAAAELKTHAFATVFLGLGNRKQGRVIPLAAVVAEGGRSWVYRKTGSTFARTEVTLGVKEGNRVAVESGLSAGDEIAASGTFVLASEEKKDELKGHDH